MIKVSQAGLTHLFPHPPHAVQAPGGVFQIVIADVFDLPAKPDAVFHAPAGVGIDPEGILRKLFGQGSVSFQLIAGAEHAGLQLVGAKAIGFLQLPGVLHQLFHGAHFPVEPVVAGVAEKEVAGQGNLIPQLTS
jgi:hypothetical protein